MRFNASFLELALAYASGAYVFGEVCVFGGTWHNLPAVGLGFAGIIYCSARAMECVAAWISAKWRRGRGGDQVHREDFLAWEQLDPPVPHSAQHRRIISFPPRRAVNHADRPAFRLADSA
jgi:hypothetical protein